jgi:hypothetical protein
MERYRGSSLPVLYRALSSYQAGLLNRPGVESKVTGPGAFPWLTHALCPLARLSYRRWDSEGAKGRRARVLRGAMSFRLGANNRANNDPGSRALGPLPPPPSSLHYNNNPHPPLAKKARR